jgi:hypothetical protein
MAEEGLEGVALNKAVGLGASQSFSLGNSSSCHSEGAPATEESVFTWFRSQSFSRWGSGRLTRTCSHNLILKL